MIMRKHPRNDTKNPAGQIITPIDDEERQRSEAALEELVRISQELGLYDEMLEIPPKHFEKPVIKELSEYEEIVRKNNSENSR